MKTVFRNPNSVPESFAINADTHFVFFFYGKQEAREDSLNIQVAENTALKVTVIDFSDADFTMKLNIRLKESASSEVSLAALNSSKKKVFAFDVTHEGQKSYSRTKMGGINDGNGVLRFLGSSIIVNGAHKSDTRQEGKITNLSPDCKSEVSPALLIKENDVKASHGAALGAYNPDHLFYLMSRGLTLEESKRLVTVGSLLPMIESAEDDKVIEEAKQALGALTL